MRTSGKILATPSSRIVDFIPLVYVDIKKVINNFMPMYKLQKFAF